MIVDIQVKLPSLQGFPLCISLTFRSQYEILRFMHSFSTPQSELEGLHGLLHHDDESRLVVQTPGFVKFCDSFYMMQTEPSLQVSFFSL